jgi:hypothetical protein
MGTIFPSKKAWRGIAALPDMIFSPVEIEMFRGDCRRFTG